MKQILITLLALLMTVMGANAQEPTTYFVELTTDSKPEGASFTMTYTEGSNPAQDVSTYLVDEVVPVPAGAKVTLTVTPAKGYALTSVKARTFMDGVEMRTRTRGTDAAEGITILGDVALTPDASAPNTYTFTMPTANVRIALGYKQLATAVSIEINAANITYNGQAQEPEVVVRYAGNDVTNDFTITYANNVKAAAKDAEKAPTVTVTAKESSERFIGSASTTFTISQAKLYVKSGITASDKVYDGTTTATIDCSKAVLEGLVSGDKVTVTGITGEFADAEPGEGKTVNLDYTNAVLELAGNPATNYTLDKANSQKTTTASITGSGGGASGGGASSGDASGGDDQSGTTVVVNGDGTSITKIVEVDTDSEGTKTKTVSETTTDAAGNVVNSKETETVTKADGSTTTKIVEINIDSEGTKTKTVSETTTDAAGNVVETIETVTKADGSTTTKIVEINTDSEGTQTKTVSETTKDADGNVVNSKETETVTKAEGSTTTKIVEIDTDAEGTQTKTVSETTTDAAGNVETIETETVTKADGSSVEKEVKTTANGDVITTTNKDDGQGNVETSMTEDVKPTLGEETTATDPVTGQTEAYKEIKEDDSGILPSITNASLSVATTDVGNISLDKSTITVKKNDKEVSKTSKATLTAKKADKVIKLALKHAKKANAKKILTIKIKAQRGKIKASKARLKKKEKSFKKSHTRADEADGDEIEIESDVEYEILTDEPIIMKLMTTESDVEINSINITEDDDPTEYVSIAIGKSGKASYCGDQSLDFGYSDEVKAYIATGFDKDEGTIWLTRVKDVPAGVPVLIKGEANKTYDVPVTDSQNSYYTNMFVGNTSGDKIQIQETDGDLVNYYLSGDGTFKSVNKTANIGNNKCYLQLPGTFEAAATGVTQTVKVGSIGKASFAAPVDLDFTNVSGLKAFTATGYDKSTKTIWLTRVMKVQKGEGVLLKGDPNSYEIPSAAVQSSYENMFVGNTSGDEIRVQETSEDGSHTNYYLSGKDGSFVSVNGFAKIGNNKCYLALPTSMVAGASSTRSLEDELILEEAEMIKLPIEFKSIGSEGDGTTGVKEVKSGEVKGEEWYTLQGQRVAKPGKGLYIKNGKMVIVR